MNITLIAAMAENRVIGKNNDLIWHLPRDLKHFRELTSGHHVIMGRKTYESMGQPLPRRTNIVITRNPRYKAEGCIVVSSLEEAIKAVTDDRQPFIIGGAQIYSQAMNIADTLEITVIRHTFEGDARFPEIDMSRWHISQTKHHAADEKNAYDMDFVTFIRKEKAS